MGTRRNRRNFFSPENGVMLCVQPLTIPREPGGKYPSQHHHWPLHGELGDPQDQIHDFSKKMTSTFYFQLMGYEE